MAKKKGGERLQAAAGKTQALPAPKFGGVSRRGWKVIGAGVCVVTAGFYVLSLTDPAGQNWASTLSPFLLLGGYATIAVGIMLPDPSEYPAGTEKKLQP